jgi:hypothetical protein
MIGYFKMSVIGTSHMQKQGGVCQDSSDVIILPNGWTVAAIADGLGSAACSDCGSDIAVKSALSYIAKHVPEAWSDKPVASTIRSAFISAMKHIERKAAEDGNHVSDYDTTLTVAVYNGKNVIYGHVGDGGIIGLSPEGDFFLLTKVQKGDACNETYPLRSGAEKWSFGKSVRNVCALTLMTDGIFDLACPQKLARFNPKQPIYINYIREYMDRNINRATDERDFAALEKRVTDYFTGEGMNDTSDDKTIVGLINANVMPKVKADSYYELPDLVKIKQDEIQGLYPGLSANRRTKPTPKPEVKQEPETQPEPEPEPEPEPAPVYRSPISENARPFTEPQMNSGNDESYLGNEPRDDGGYAEREEDYEPQPRRDDDSVYMKIMFLMIILLSLAVIGLSAYIIKEKKAGGVKASSPSTSQSAAETKPKTTAKPTTEPKSESETESAVETESESGKKSKKKSDKKSESAVENAGFKIHGNTEEKICLKTNIIPL